MALDAYLARRQFERQSLVSVSIAPFVEAYSRTPATGCEPTIELRLMMLPPSGPEPLDRLLHGENRPEDVDVVVEVKSFLR